MGPAAVALDGYHRSINDLDRIRLGLSIQLVHRPSIMAGSDLGIVHFWGRFTGVMGDGLEPVLHRYGAHPGRARAPGDQIRTIPICPPSGLPGFIILHLLHTVNAWFDLGFGPSAADLRGCLPAHYS